MTANTVIRPVHNRKQVPLLIICFLATICNGFVVYKFVPIISTLMTYWGVQEGQIGILQSANSWLAVVFLIPIAYFQKRVTPRISGGTALIMMIAGNLLGFLTPNFALLIVARIMEGLGSIIINTLTQNLVFNSFSERRTTATGILNCGQYVAQVLNIFLANMLVQNFGWRAVYFYMFLFEVVFIFVWLIFNNNSVKITGLEGYSTVEQDRKEREKETTVPADGKHAGTENAKAAKLNKRSGMRAVLTNKNLWLLTISSALYGPCIIQFSSYIPTYLMTRGMELTTANNLYNIAVVCGIISMVCSGVISDKLGTRRKLAIFANLATMLIYFLFVHLPLGFVIPFMILFGLIPRMISVLTYSSIKTVISNADDVPLANSVFTTAAQLAGIVGNIILGFLIQYMGYNITVYVLMGILFACALMWVANIKVK